MVLPSVIFLVIFIPLILSTSIVNIYIYYQMINYIKENKQTEYLKLISILILISEFYVHIFFWFIKNVNKE